MSGEDDLRARQQHDEWCPKNGCRCKKCSCAEMPDCPPLATPAEPARESDGVGLRLSDVENGWVTVLWDRNGRRGRLAEAKRDLERIIAARVAEAGARALEDLANDIDSTGYGWRSVVDAERFKSHLRDRARGLRS